MNTELNILNDEYFMRAALAEAKRAFDEDEVPVGAVVVCKNRIIARAYNMTEKLRDVTAHAEMLALTAASNFLNSKFLDDCTLYVTLEPCVMCAGAALWTRPVRIVYGASDPGKGYTRLKAEVLHPKTSVSSGILGEECGDLLKTFFSKKRE
jgi:tRNA(adenine34) deaminase